jgi:hypothetical protein
VRRHLILASVIALTAFGIGRPVQAAASLTDAEVASLIATLNELGPVLSKHREALAKFAATHRTQAADDPCIITPDMRGAPGFDQMEKTVHAHGYGGAEAWCRAMKRMTESYISARIDREAPDFDQRIADARKRLDSAENLSAEQKKQLGEQINIAERLRRPKDVSAEDKATVLRHQSEIEKALSDFAAAVNSGQ